jgi:flagellar biosynthesis protein FlhF
MRIKKIITESLSEGKVFLKKELGENAIILSTRNIKNNETGKNQLEIVAAIDEKAPVANQNLPVHQKKPEAINSSEINRLIETISFPYLEYLSPELKSSYISLKKIGFDDRFIGSILREISSKSLPTVNLEEIINLIVSKIRTENLFKKKISRKVYGFVGSAGVGKTSTLLKFAALHSLMNSSNILVVGADNYNFGANEILLAYCKVLGLAFEKAGSEDELKRIIDEKKDYDLILIDFDSQSIVSNSNIENILLLSANANRNFIERQLRKYSSSYVAFTGVEEKFEIQSIIDLIIERNLTFCFYSHGQKIPDDLEIADIDGLKKMIVDNG